MRSPDPRTLLIGLSCALALTSASTPLVQSGIPRGLDGSVERVDVRFEKRPGSDDVYLVSVDGRRVILDRAVARHLEPGDRIRKQPWSTTLEVDDRAVPLRPSGEGLGIAVASAAAPLVVVLLLTGRRFAIGRLRTPRLERERGDVGTDGLAGPPG